MTRRLLNLAKVVSTLLLVAVAVLVVAAKPEGIDVTLRESPALAVMAGVQDRGFYLLTLSAPRPGWREVVPRVLYDWAADFAGFRVGPELPPAHWPGTPFFVVVPGWFLALVFGTCALVCQTLGRRKGEPVPRRTRALTRWLYHPRWYVPILVLAGVGWASSYLCDGWTYRVNGNHAGLIAVGDPECLILGVRGGWPSRDWIEREHLRAIGGLWGDGLWPGYTLFGFGVLAGESYWNGHQRLAVWHKAVALPWWFLLLLPAAAPAEQLRRWLWSNRRSERRRRGGLCLMCGYNLTGNVSGVCPECGTAR